MRRWPERPLVVLGVAAGLLGLATALAPDSNVALAALTALAALPIVLVALELGSVRGVAIGALGFGVVAWHAAARDPSSNLPNLVVVGVALPALGAVSGRFSDRMRALRKRHEQVLESGLRLGRPIGEGSLAGRVAEAAMLVVDAEGVLVSIDGELPVRVGTVAYPSVAIPLVAGDVRVGRLELYNSSELGPEDRAALELVALQGALARVNELAVIKEGERARVESELRLAQHGLLERRSEVNYVLASQEDERRRIATKLHEELAQVLAVVLMGLKLLSRHNSAGGGDAIADLRGQVIGVLEDVRALAVELRSPALTQLGLVPALESLARDMRERGDGEIAVRADEVPEPIPDAVETAAYRIVQEALQIARGASPTPSLRVRVGRCPQRTDARLELVLELPQATVAPSLAGIRARTKLVSGSLEAQTSAERGTRLRVMLPLAGSGRTATAE